MPATTARPGAPSAYGYAPSGKDTGIVRSKGRPRIPSHEGLELVGLRDRKPSWLKVRSPGGPRYLGIRQLMRSESLHTSALASDNALPNEPSTIRLDGRCRLGWSDQ